MSRRSIAAIRRPNTALDDVKVAETVSDILSPLGKQPGAAVRAADNLGIPDTNNNPFVCIAAFEILHCNINGTIRVPNNEKAAETGGLFIRTDYRVDSISNPQA